MLYLNALPVMDTHPSCLQFPTQQSMSQQTSSSVYLQALCKTISGLCAQDQGCGTFGHGVLPCEFIQVLPGCFYNGYAGSSSHGCPKFLHPFQISVLSIFLIIAFTICVKYYLTVLSSSDKGFTSVVPHILLRACMCKCLAIAWLGRNSVFWLNVLCLLSFSFPSCVRPTFRTFS